MGQAGCPPTTAFEGRLRGESRTVEQEISELDEIASALRPRNDKRSSRGQPAVKRRAKYAAGKASGFGWGNPSEIVNDHGWIRKKISHVVNTSHGINCFFRKISLIAI